MFKVLAQSFTTTQRIAKTLRETSEAEVTRLVSGELEVAGFYIISITAV